MIDKVKAATLRLFYTAFFLSFIWLTAHIIVNGGWYVYKEVRLLLCIVIALAALVGSWRFIKNFEAVIGKYSRVITIAFLTLMAVLQIVLGLKLRYKPIFDIDAIYGGAIEWVETGSFTSYNEYYSYFFNNFGGLRFMYWIFRIARALGMHDYFFAAAAANCALSVFTMYVTGQVAKKLLGIRGQMMAYVLFAISPPFYFIAPAFYTDAMSMPFPILIYWLYLLAKEQVSLQRRLLLYALMGAAAALGAQIKATVVIAFIAIVIEALFTWDKKRTAAMSVVVAAMLLLGQMGLEHTIYQHLDRAEAEQMRTPVLHWVMMGLTGYGMYNPSDYEFTRSFSDPQEQDAAIKAEIKSRMQNLGAGGLVSLLTTKGEICFGDGTYGLSYCLNGEDMRETKLRDWLLFDGTHHDMYRHICTGVLLALYILTIAGAARDASGVMSNTFFVMIPRLAMFGILLFFICWEAHGRYISNFIPLIFISALLGLSNRSWETRLSNSDPPVSA